MTRRNGIIAAMGGLIAVMAGKAKAEQVPLTLMQFPKSSVTFNLDSFVNYQFTLGDEKVTLTPAEIMAALKEPQP